jgi:hypothetical protein
MDTARVHKNQNFAPRSDCTCIMVWWLAVSSFTAAAAATAPPPHCATASTAIQSLQDDEGGTAPSPPTCNLIDDVLHNNLTCTLDKYCADIYPLLQNEDEHFGKFGNVTCKGGIGKDPYFFVAQNKQVVDQTGWVSGLSLQVNYKNLIEWVKNSPPRVVFADGVSFHLNEVTTDSCTMTLAGEQCYSCEFCRNEDGNQTMAVGFNWFAVDCTNVVPGLTSTTCTNPIGWVEFLKQVDKKKPLFDTTPAPAAPTNSSKTDLMAAAGVGGVIGVVIGVAALYFLQSLCRRRRRLASASASAPEAVATPRSHQDFTSRLTTAATALPPPPPPPPPEAPMAEVPATGPSITEPVSTLSSRMTRMIMTPHRRSTDPPVVVSMARTQLPPPIIAEVVLMVDNHHDNNNDNHYNNHHHTNNDNNLYDPEAATAGPLFKDQAQSSYISL